MYSSSMSGVGASSRAKRALVGLQRSLDADPGRSITHACVAMSSDGTSATRTGRALSSYTIWLKPFRSRSRSASVVGTWAKNATRLPSGLQAYSLMLLSWPTTILASPPSRGITYNDR